MPDKEKSLQAQIPEAVASANYSLISPNGFPLGFTLRGKSGQELLTTTQELEKELTELGYQPDLKTGKKSYPKKEIEYVEGRMCPNCGARLVKGVTRTGKPFIKCEKQKWNPQTKSVVGCPFVEWGDSQKTY